MGFSEIGLSHYTDSVDTMAKSDVRGKVTWIGGIEAAGMNGYRIDLPGSVGFYAWTQDGTVTIRAADGTKIRVV